MEVAAHFHENRQPNFAGVVGGALPGWLEEHCRRLMDGDESIRNLNLNLRRMDGRMMQSLVEALSQSTHDIRAINVTSTLDVHGHDSDQTLIPLAILLRHHASLQTIHLSYNQLRNVTILKETLSHQGCVLQSLHLDHNQLSTASAVALAEGLEQNPHSSLRVLNLNSNQIGDVGGIALGKMLLANKSLRRLSVAKNRLGKASLQMLWQALHTCNTTLVELNLDENPFCSSEDDCMKWKGKVQRYLLANRAGRYLLHYDPPPTLALWPRVLERCGAGGESSMELSSSSPRQLSDTQFYFLKEVPDLTNRRQLNMFGEGEES